MKIHKVNGSAVYKETIPAAVGLTYGNAVPVHGTSIGVTATNAASVFYFQTSPDKITWITCPDSSGGSGNKAQILTRVSKWIRAVVPTDHEVDITVFT